MKAEVLAQPFGAKVGDRLISELGSGRWQRFRCAVAFAKRSGVQYLDRPLRKFVKAGGIAELAIGIDSGGTSFEALSHLASAISPSGRLIVSHEIRSSSTSFHPKLYAFTPADPLERGLIIVGSSNITEGGLFTNHELSTALSLDAADADDAALLAAFTKQLDAWQDLTSGFAVPATRSRLLALYDEGRLPGESRLAAGRGALPPPGGGTSGLFPGRRRRSKPAHRKSLGEPLVPLPPRPPARVELPPTPPPPKPLGSAHNALYIDTGSGTAKTELFLSKTALTSDPAFFRHPFTGRTTPKRGGSKTPQPELDPWPTVDIRLLDAAGAPVAKHTYSDYSLRVWEYAIGKNAKHELRVNIPAPLLQSLPQDCILEMRRHPVRAGIDYRLDFLEPGSRQWKQARARAATPLPNSTRKFGWG